MLKKIIKDTEIPVKTKYFFDDYEIEIDEVTGAARQLHYVSAASGLFAIIEMQNNITTPYYVHADYLGTYNLITNADGNRHERLSFDP